MKKILEAIFENSSLTAIQVAFISSIVLGLFSFILWLIAKYWDNLLHFFFGRKFTLFKHVYPADRIGTYFNMLRYYIDSHSQDTNPDVKENLAENDPTHISRQPALNHFLSVFDDQYGESRHLILGGTGMGKSTFLLKLYEEYQKRWYKKYDIYLIQIHLCPSSKSLEKLIDDINDKQRAILLLDGLDEDYEAIRTSEKFRFTESKTRLRVILEKTRTFQYVLISARTQLFRTEESSKKVFVINNGEKSETKLIRYFISPFTPQEVRQYIAKRYPLINKNYFANRRKRYASLHMTQKFDNIFLRPLVLSYVETLVKKQFIFEFQVYEEIIRQWIIKREQKRKKSEDQQISEKFQQSLIEYSQFAARRIYDLNHSTEALTLEELDQAFKDFHHSKKYRSALGKEEARVQSLITRSGDDFKLAHRSFYSFFLACECRSDQEFLNQFQFLKQRQAWLFYNEMIVADYLKHQLSDANLEQFQKLSVESQIKKLKTIINTEGKLRDLQKYPLKDMDFR